MNLLYPENVSQATCLMKLQLPLETILMLHFKVQVYFYTELIYWVVTKLVIKGSTICQILKLIKFISVWCFWFKN